VGGARDQKDLPSSALIENDLTEICITVGFEAAVETGRLFACTSAFVLLLTPKMRSRQVETDLQVRVVSSCNIRPACRIRRYDGEGGWLGSVQSVWLA
jgi:hypothetical protein